MSNEKTDGAKLAHAVAAAAATGEKTAVELLRLLERQRLLGDPRIRVQVPTDGTNAESVLPLGTARRYSID